MLACMVPRISCLRWTFALLASGCGGRIAGGVGASDDAASDTPLVLDARGDDSATGDGAITHDANDPCFLEDGTRVCEVAGCATSCTGWSCAHFSTSADTLADFGVCVKDLPRPSSQCTICHDESALCAWISGGLYACAQRAVCERLAREASAPGYCLYEDKTPWAPGETIPSLACPAGGAALGMCGGACGACPSGTVCEGRSPTHPFGVCAPTAPKYGPGCGALTSSYNGCESASEACMIFKTTDAFASIAATFGFCLPATQCRGLRGALPGGVACKDAHGDELP